jgi:hypothetical protein
MITAHHSITNTTDKFLLVGNSSHVIAAYDSKAEAVEGMEIEVPCIVKSGWAVVRILAPGETDAGNYSQLLPMSSSQQAEAAQQLAEFLAGA